MADRRGNVMNLKEDPVLGQYNKELKATQKYKAALLCCPVHVLLACACGDCPAKSVCVGGNPGSHLGIDHQTVVKLPNGLKRYTFRPYKTRFDGPCRELLEKFCEHFKLKLEVLDVNTYSAEAGDKTYTVHITPTDESLRFRRGGDVLGTPWYGKDSPLRLFKDSKRK